MLTIKMMGAEDAPDTNTSKSFRLVSVNTRACVAFLHVPAVRGGADNVLIPLDDTDQTVPRDAVYIPCVVVMEVDGSGAVNWYPEGNTYVMNAAGKTVATFAYTTHTTHTTLEAATRAV